MPAGAADEPAGAAGAAHLLEHLLLLHEPDLAPVVAHGNAFVSSDATLFVAAAPPEAAIDVVAATLSVFRGVDVPPEALERERAAILREGEGRRASPAGRLGALVREALLPGTPLGRDPIGAPADIEALALAHAVAFHAERYRADAAVLVVAGPIAPEAVRARVEAEIGRAEARPRPARALDPEPPAAERVALALADPAVGAPERVLAVLARVPETPRAFAATGLLLDYLASGLPGAPRPELERAATAIFRDIAFAARTLAPGWVVLEVRLSARPGTPAAALDDLEAALRARLAELAEGGIEAEVLARVARRAAIRLREADARPVGTGVALAHWIAAGRDLASWRDRARIADAVTPADTSAVARALASPHRTVAADLLPAPR